MKKQYRNIINKTLKLLILMIFISSSVLPTQDSLASSLDLPLPGQMLTTSPAFKPTIIQGMKIDPQNPLQFEFLIDPGQVPLNNIEKKTEYRKLIKYFLTSLTTPEKEMWVNLSPYEHNRIISNDFGKTEMGRDMLGQDYILKQLTASLVYPEGKLGKKFWDLVYERVRKETGRTDIPVSTFNKVWILPQSATVFEKGNMAIITESRLKVMMEEDYLSLDKHNNLKNPVPSNKTHASSSETIREIVLPAIEKEINEGKAFANLRQIYNSMILASWFKQNLKKHILNSVYTNQNKSNGIELKDPKENEEIFLRYEQAYKKGVYNYIKEEPDPKSGEMIPRKYFSGGADMSMLGLTHGILKTTAVLGNSPGFTEETPWDDALIELVPASTRSYSSWGWSYVRNIRLAAAAVVLTSSFIFSPVVSAQIPLSTITIETIQELQLSVNDYYALKAFNVLDQLEDKNSIDIEDIVEFDFNVKQIGPRTKEDRISQEAINALKQERAFMIEGWTTPALDLFRQNSAPLSENFFTFLSDEITKAGLIKKVEAVHTSTDAYLGIPKSSTNTAPVHQEQPIPANVQDSINALGISSEDFFAARALNILASIQKKGKDQRTGFADRRIAEEFLYVIRSIPLASSSGSKLSEKTKIRLKALGDLITPIYELGGYIPVEESEITRLIEEFKESGLYESRGKVAAAVEDNVVKAYEQRIFQAYAAVNRFVDGGDQKELDDIGRLPKDLEGINIPGFSRPLALIEHKIPLGFEKVLTDFSHQLNTGELKTKEEIMEEATLVGKHRILWGGIKAIAPPDTKLPVKDAYEKRSPAMTSPPVGGIDFDAKYLQLNIQTDGKDMLVPLGYEWLAKNTINGFTPQILDIKSGVGFDLSFFNGLAIPHK